MERTVRLVTRTLLKRLWCNDPWPPGTSVFGELRTRIRLRVDRYIGEDRQAHLLSVFGNDSDVGAITAAVHEKAAFSLTFPDVTTKDVTLGEHASCYKGAVALPGRKHPVRHLLAVSQYLHTNGSAGQTILLRYRREEAWAS